DAGAAPEAASPILHARIGGAGGGHRLGKLSRTLKPRVRFRQRRLLQRRKGSGAERKFGGGLGDWSGAMPAPYFIERIKQKSAASRGALCSGSLRLSIKERCRARVDCRGPRHIVLRRRHRTASKRLLVRSRRTRVGLC